MLVKKKDVNDYFAARRNRRPLSVKRAGPVAAPSKDKRDGKASGTAPLGAPAPTQDLHVPFFTIEPSVGDPTLQAPRKWKRA